VTSSVRVWEFGLLLPRGGGGGWRGGGAPEIQGRRPHRYEPYVQVVAGMNYALVVEATLTCRNGNGLAAVDRVSIAAKVYQPPAAVDPEVPLPSPLRSIAHTPLHTFPSSHYQGHG